MLLTEQSNNSKYGNCRNLTLCALAEGGELDKEPRLLPEAPKRRGGEVGEKRPVVPGWYQRYEDLDEHQGQQQGLWRSGGQIGGTIRSGKSVDWVYVFPYLRRYLGQSDSREKYRPPAPTASIFGWSPAPIGTPIPSWDPWATPRRFPSSSRLPRNPSRTGWLPQAWVLLWRWQWRPWQ